MGTKIIMILSAIFMGIIGASASFLPHEIALFLNIDPNGITLLLLNLISALYLGFAILNWMSKGTKIGGIYNKPLCIGNLMHFGVGAIGLIKMVFKNQEHLEIFMLLAAAYTIFAILFAFIFFTNPIKAE